MGDFLGFLHFNIRMSKLLPCFGGRTVSPALGPPLRRNGRAGALNSPSFLHVKYSHHAPTPIKKIIAYVHNRKLRNAKKN